MISSNSDDPIFVEKTPAHYQHRIKALEQENNRITMAYQELAEKERESRHFIENTREAIVVFDRELRLLQANPAAIRLLGYPEQTGSKRIGIEYIFARPGDLDEVLRQLLFTGSADRFETTLCRTSTDQEKPMVIGSGFTHLDRQGRVKHIEFILTDITEHRKMERRLQQSQKIEAIGTLAGGVAHDFNNLLMGIQGRASLMGMDLPSTHPHAEHVAAIEEYIHSGAGLTRQLLGFARGGRYEIKPIGINELVSQSAAMFGRTKKQIRIHTRLENKPLVVKADQGQIEQVLLNMYVNAWQAMPTGGELYLETEITELDEAFCKPYRLKPGQYGKISITDTGIGMNESTRQQIFDPFFTTKTKSRGTGLGLASAYGIIKNHGGMITVYSEIGHGTAFNIFLPLSGKAAACPPALPQSLKHGSETILLVDDEHLIIDVARAMLKKIGYRVIVAENGEDAVEAAKAMGDELDMVILDLIMPGIDGAETFDRLREVDPGIPILLSSGYALNGQAATLMAKGCNGFIQKPFNIIELSNKIRNALNGQRCSTARPERAA